MRNGVVGDVDMCLWSPEDGEDGAILGAELAEDGLEVEYGLG